MLTLFKFFTLLSLYGNFKGIDSAFCLFLLFLCSDCSFVPESLQEFLHLSLSCWWKSLTVWWCYQVLRFDSISKFSSVDFFSVSMSWFNSSLGLCLIYCLDQCDKDKARVLVHCMSGKSRWVHLSFSYYLSSPTTIHTRTTLPWNRPQLTWTDQDILSHSALFLETFILVLSLTLFLTDHQRLL